MGRVANPPAWPFPPAATWLPPDVPVDLRQPEAVAFRRAARRRSRSSSAVSLAVVLAVALAAGSLADGLGWALATVVVVVATGALSALATLPFGLAGHRAARACGLSRQDGRGWLADRARALAFAAALGLPAALGLVWLQRSFPDGWPLVAAGVALAVEVALAVVFPVLILPRFLRSEPLPDGPLRQRALDVSARARVVVADVRLLRLGEKTRAGNAMVVGLGPTRRILVGDTLAGVDGVAGDAPVDEGRLDETAAVLAHKLAHHRHRDIGRSLALSCVVTPATLLLAALLLGLAPAALAHGGAGDPAALPAFALAAGIAGLPADLLGSWHSRRRERAADAFALRVAAPLGLARAFARLAADGLAELDPPRLTRPLASHPPLGERIAAALGAGARGPTPG